MFASLSSAWMLRLKKYGYWIWLIAVLGIPLSYWWSLGSDYPNAWPWLVISVVFGLIPILDAIVGRDPANPRKPAKCRRWKHRATTAYCPGHRPAVAGHARLVRLDPRPRDPLGLGRPTGLDPVGGHRDGRHRHHRLPRTDPQDPQLEQNAGGLLLAAVCYAGFKVEHVRGHHVHVSTPEDASSSRYGQSLYSFLPHAYKHNFLNAWRLEAERLKRACRPCTGATS